VSLLRDKMVTIALAESLTGGMIMSEIVNVSGASQYFKGGIVAYSNQSKTDLLGIDKDIVGDYGVSEEVAKRMAFAACELFHTNIGVGTTGFAEGFDEKHTTQAYICICEKKDNHVYEILHLLHIQVGYDCTTSTNLLSDADDIESIDDVFDRNGFRHLITNMIIIILNNLLRRDGIN